ncbi:cox cluster protein [Haloplanus litoreus]|uniref:Cox cluster protein n=1 Tax=Haloplanus litoreus TaxID=767515 RepID=A0ABD6A0X1_9EURY
MDDQPGLSDQYRMASPWPPFVAFGIPLAELGILFDVFVVAVAGLLLFCGSLTGMIREAGYVETVWRPLAVFAVLLFVVGGVFTFSDVNLVTRGYAIITAGGILAFAGISGELFVPKREPI